MLEFEKKIPLTAMEYYFLCKHKYSVGKTALQINCYYDIDDFELIRQGNSCRISGEDGVYTVTIKKYQRRWEDCSVENSIAVKNPYDHSSFRNINIFCQDGLETVRGTYLSKPGALVMLGKNRSRVGYGKNKLSRFFQPKGRNHEMNGRRYPCILF